VQSRSNPAARWWQWPTILSLDAPAVAVAWQGALATAAGVSLPWPERAVLAASVWLAYCADRWIEGWRLQAGRVEPERHRFSQRWRWPLLLAWTVVLAGAVALSFRRLTAAELARGAGLLAAVSAYLLSHQLVHRSWRGRLPKEACTALLLGGGAAVFVLGRPGLRVPPFGTALGLFVLLCLANCVLISVWEAEVDRRHGETSLAQQFRAAGALAHLLPWATAILALAALVRVRPGSPVFLCALASALLLAALHRAEPRLGRIPARVLADVALLTPLALLLWGPAA